MNKKLSVIFAIIMIVTIFVSTPAFAASYKSYKQLKLDYSLSDGMYSTGKNGYKFVMFTGKSGNTVSYRKPKFTYVSSIGHSAYVATGTTKKAKITSSTKYYQSAPWSEVGLKLKAYQYSYGSSKFKALKILQKASKSDTFNEYYKNSVWYVKIKNGKIKTIIKPVIFAI